MIKADGGSPFKEPEEIVEPTIEARLALADYGQGDLDQKIPEFAHLLADRLNEKIVPMGFLMASTLLLYDLKAGSNGFTGEAISSPIVGISSEDEAQIIKALPSLARVAFSEKFADAVEAKMKEMGMLTPEESVFGIDLTEGEIITEEITEMTDVEKRIIADARERVADLDWQFFGIKTEEVYKQFEVVYKLVLRQSPYHLPVNLLVDQSGKERGILMETPDHQKMQLFGEYWLAMLASPINPELATLTRDHLFLKTPEAIGGMSGLEPEVVLGHFAGTTKEEFLRSSMGRAAVRTHNLIGEHPELLKSGETL